MEGRLDGVLQFCGSQRAQEGQAEQMQCREGLLARLCQGIMRGAARTASGAWMVVPSMPTSPSFSPFLPGATANARALTFFASICALQPQQARHAAVSLTSGRPHYTCQGPSLIYRA